MVRPHRIPIDGFQAATNSRHWRVNGGVSARQREPSRTRDIDEEPGRLMGTAVLAPDGRRLYFTSAAIESDIWTMRFSR